MEGGENYRQSLGRKGEDLVCGFLLSKGHTILERNWRTGHLEIDIISFNDEGIHFVEVKTRQKSIQAPPQENVDSAKQKRIARAALRYMKTSKSLPGRDLECIFDVIAVTSDNDEMKIEWIPQAYIPLYI